MIYKNISEPRGVVIVFNNIFRNTTSYREGAEYDSINIQHVFQDMGYQTLIFEDQTKQETIDKFDKIKSNTLQEFRMDNIDSFVLFLLSHGNDDNFQTNDGYLMTMQEICGKFTNTGSKHLIGKPKMIFTNFCRGKFRESGTLQTDNIGLGEKDAAQDMLVYFASQINIQALRKTDSGTLFVETVCETLAIHAHEYEICELNCIIIQKMKSKQATTPEIKILGFEKKFYFNPI